MTCFQRTLTTGPRRASPCRRSSFLFNQYHSVNNSQNYPLISATSSPKHSSCQTSYCYVEFRLVWQLPFNWTASECTECFWLVLWGFRFGWIRWDCHWILDPFTPSSSKPSSSDPVYACSWASSGCSQPTREAASCFRGSLLSQQCLGGRRIEKISLILLDPVFLSGCHISCSLQPCYYFIQRYHYWNL